MRRFAAPALAATGIAALCMGAAAPASADTVTSTTVAADQIVDMVGDYATYWSEEQPALVAGPTTLPLTIPALSTIPVGSDDPHDGPWGTSAFTVPAPLEGCTREVTAITVTLTVSPTGDLEIEEPYAGIGVWPSRVGAPEAIEFTEDDVTFTPENPFGSAVEYTFDNVDPQPYLWFALRGDEEESVTFTARIELPEALGHDEVVGAFHLEGDNLPEFTIEDYSFDVTDICPDVDDEAEDDEELAATGSDATAALTAGGAAALLGAALLFATRRRSARTTA